MRVYACCRVGLNLLICLWLSAASAQVAPQHKTRLTTGNGLPNNTVTGIEQDRAGFIWIATHDGLARYDGRAVKVFRHRPGDSTSLRHNKIRTFDRNATGTFLITTGSGSFQEFDPISERFTMVLDERDLARKNSMLIDGQLSADGRHFWGAMPGIRLVHYDRHLKIMRQYDVPTLTNHLHLNMVHDFVLTASGHLYGEGWIGLVQFNTKTGRCRTIRYPFAELKGEKQTFFGNNYHRLVEAPNGEIAIFGNSSIAMYNPVDDRFRLIPIPDVDNHQPSIVYFTLKTLADNRLYLSYIDRLYRLDHDRFTPVEQSGPRVGRLTPWLLDASGVLWTGGESAGLNRTDTRALPFRFRPKRKSFEEDLIEQDLGVSLPDSFEVWSLPRWPRYTLAPDKRGYLIDPLRIYQHLPTQHSVRELRNLRVTDGHVGYKLCLKVSGRHFGEGVRLWFYTNYRGLVEAAPDDKAGRLYPQSQLPLTRPSPNYDAGDIEPMGNSVWVGSQYGLGLFRYDLQRQRYDSPLVNNPTLVNSLPVNTINCLRTDPIDGTLLWIGTEGGGLCRLDTRTMTFRRLGAGEGFPASTINSIEVDAQKMLWLGSTRGLIRLNPKTMTWRHFTTADGLPEDEFVRTSSARLPDGRLVFGTPNGRVIFDPAAIRDDGYEPPVVLTSLLINNKPVEANQPSVEPDSSPLPAPLNTLLELVLDHTQNFLTIGFAGLDYGKAEKLSYRYQLTGVDEDWVTTGTQNTANYTQLAPGRYLFRVNSTTADGRWSRRIKQLAIVITPPFWATWWAYLAYALAAGGLVLGFIRFRIGQGRQQQEILLKRREAEQLRAVDEVKTRFFSNITHEFRTPLTLILSPTARLLTNPGYDAFTRQTLSTIYQNAGQLLRLINQLLELSKLEGGNMTVSLSRGDAVAFVERLADLFQPLADSRGIALRIETSVAGHRTGELWLFDADKWEKIITNLLSNALKFTPTGGQVSLTVNQPRFADATTPGRNAEPQFVLHIADTGIGIPAQHIAHIFDRFYQADDSRTRAYEGTGIGLALVKELTDLLGGTISVQSSTEADRSPGPTGTTFTLTLPLLPADQQTDAPELILPDAPPVATQTAPTNHQPDATGAISPADTLPKSIVADDAPLVLVVDDNDELRAFVARELASRYRVLTAGDGEEGWAICQRDLPEVVVTDVMMPRLDGYQLTHCIKSTLATNHIAVVLLTAKAAHESRIAGLEQGADDYLTKPFHTDELMLRLANLLTRQANLRAYIHRQLSGPAAPTPEEPNAARPVVDAFVSQLHQAIESRLDDPTLGVNDLAEAVAMSRRTLHRKLTTTTNLAANDFIRHYRLQRATQLLRAGRSIAETAYSVGFESPSYFSAMFKQTYHQTPSEFLGG